MNSPLLVVNQVSKSFGASRALNGVSFALDRGEIHALIGENGAGKSTLMKILSGAIRPDQGTILLNGQPYAPRSPKDAKALGVAMIYQELALAPHLSVEANIMLGQEKTRFGLLNRREHRQVVLRALQTLDHPEINPMAAVGALSVGAQQLVEVARALVSNDRLIIFDEPTSSLTDLDAQRLFEVIRRLSASGISIVYISHFLEEARSLAHRYTVLRDGETIGSGLMRDVEVKDLIRQMVGRDLNEVYPRVPHEPGETILELSSLRVQHRFPIHADLSLRRGEILGIAGLVGSGRTELLRAIFGLEPIVSGRLIVKSLPIKGGSPASRIRRGLGFLSENRKEEGLALARSIEDNITYSCLRRYSCSGWLNLNRRRRDVNALLQGVNIKCEGPAQRVANLSGGNQQKVALARLLHQEADIILLDEPTRGIDIGSKAEIYRLIGELAARGAAVLMVSSYLPELFGVCDRLAVLSRGTLSAPRAIQEWDPDLVLTAATA